MNNAKEQKRAIEKLEELLKDKEPIEKYLKNSYLYNNCISLLNNDKQKKIFTFFHNKFKEKNILNEFYLNFTIDFIKNNVYEILKDKNEIEYLKNKLTPIFIDLFFDKYYMEIKYQELINFIKENYKILDINYKIKLFLMFLHYSSIEYAKDKKLGYTRINFNQLFNKELKEFLLKELVNVYSASNLQEKKMILNYLIILKDIIYIHSDIFFKVINEIMKKNLELYSIDSSLNEFININYYIFIYILSITTLKEIETFKNTEENYQKQLIILFLKNGILIQELFQKGKIDYPNIFFDKNYEILYLIKNFNKKYIFLNKKENFIYVLDYLIEKFKKKEKLLNLEIKDIEENVNGFKSWLEIFWKKEIEQFFTEHKNEIEEYLEKKGLKNITIYNLLINL